MEEESNNQFTSVNIRQASIPWSRYAQILIYSLEQVLIYFHSSYNRLHSRQILYQLESLSSLQDPEWFKAALKMELLFRQDEQYHMNNKFRESNLLGWFQMLLRNVMEMNQLWFSLKQGQQDLISIQLLSMNTMKLGILKLVFDQIQIGN